MLGEGAAVTCTRGDDSSWNHPFGNDELGRDILSRILLGTRVSMRVGATVVLLSGIAGVLIGGFAVNHVLPNIIQPVLIQASIGMAAAILAEASLSFLGSGFPRPRRVGAPCSTMAAVIYSMRRTWWSFRR